MMDNNPKKLTRGINHIGLTVPDLDQATTFFKQALDAKFVYNGLTTDDEPRNGATTDKQLGLSSGAMVIKQRLLRIGNGANLELFEIVSNRQASPVSLEDIGWNHICFYVDDIEYTIKSVTSAGGTLLSQVHENSRHEDTEGNASVYFRTPWGSLVELQSIPNGYYYPENNEAKTWIPQAESRDNNR